MTAYRLGVDPKNKIVAPTDLLPTLYIIHREHLAATMGGGTFFKVGGAQVHAKQTIENFCGLNWQL